MYKVLSKFFQISFPLFKIIPKIISFIQIIPKSITFIESFSQKLSFSVLGVYGNASIRLFAKSEHRSDWTPVRRIDVPIFDGGYDFSLPMEDVVSAFF